MVLFIVKSALGGVIALDMVIPLAVDKKDRGHVQAVECHPILKAVRCLFIGVCPSEDLRIFLRKNMPM
jgi:hypothetical protein